ncbi:MAG: sensor histidine kinase [Lachnospiraceae bacterium]|nr:sensor histidine kinase [Lachnospiraceae bacterium]
MYSFQRMNLRRRLITMGVGLILPLVIIIAFLIYQLNIFCKSYDAIVLNLTKANEYNLEFKSDFDSVLYQMVARSLTKDEVSEVAHMKAPDAMISDAENTFRRLRTTTNSVHAADRISSILKLMETLRNRMDDINGNIDSESAYEDNMERLDSDIRILTELIQERIIEYIYYESESMEEVRQQMDEQRLRVMNVAVIAVGVVLIYAVTFYILISKSITRPVADLELRLLQAQINPHFLYNTLDNIVWLAEDGKTGEVEDMVTSLSQFFRTTLAGGEDFVRISDEVSHIEAYLHIQHLRYQDILSYEISIPDELKTYRIIKLTLQPIVENALYHGIKNKRGGGSITISAGDEDRNIRLIVEDTGIGMKEDELQNVRSIIEGKTRPSSDNTGFGMANIAERIRLNYGPGYGMTIESEYDKGTRVEIVIPKKI